MKKRKKINISKVRKQISLDELAREAAEDDAELINMYLNPNDFLKDKVIIPKPEVTEKQRVLFFSGMYDLMPDCDTSAVRIQYALCKLDLDSKIFKQVFHRLCSSIKFQEGVGLVGADKDLVLIFNKSGEKDYKKILNLDGQTTSLEWIGARNSGLIGGGVYDQIVGLTDANGEFFRKPKSIHQVKNSSCLKWVSDRGLFYVEDNNNIMFENYYSVPFSVYENQPKLFYKFENNETLTSLEWMPNIGLIFSTFNEVGLISDKDGFPLKDRTGNPMYRSIMDLRGQSSIYTPICDLQFIPNYGLAFLCLRGIYKILNTRGEAEKETIFKDKCIAPSKMTYAEFDKND